MKKKKRRAQPVCPLCTKKTGKLVKMIARSSPPIITYYYCPTEGCKQSKKMPRQRHVAMQPPINVERRNR